MVCVGRIAALLLLPALAGGDDMVTIDAGYYSPLYVTDGAAKQIPVASFRIDRFPVTNAEFSRFIDVNAAWAPGRTKPIFVDANYLQHWADHSMETDANRPVTNVSWFAARAYCEWQGKRLPRIDEWEYAAAASADSPNGKADPEYRAQLLEWYSRPGSLKIPEVSVGTRNYWGIHGLHDLVWEHVEDYNSILVTGESRGDNELDNQLYCGAGAAGAVDPGDYSMFMRYALRSSYEANTTMTTLGFRCAADLETQ